MGSLDQSPETQPPDPILDTFAEYGSGRLLFVRGGTLMSQPFDVDRLSLTGEPTPIGAYTHTLAPISGGGVIAYGGVLSPSQLTWVSRDGKPIGTIGEPGDITTPRVSPDDSTVAFIRYDTGPGDLWLVEPRRGAYQFTFQSAIEYPFWSPDGKRLAYSRLSGGGFRLVQRSADGVGDETPLHELASVGLSSDWSRDGLIVLRGLVDPNTKGDIWVVPLSKGDKAFPYLNNDYHEAQPRLSPNGRWLAYVTDRLGRVEVYVDAFSGDASNRSAARGTWPISTGGGSRPVWSRDGKQLFFISADRKMMAVDVNPDAQGRFDFAAPKPLFDAAISGNPWDEFDVSGDGRFLLPVPGQRTTREPLTVIVNWPQLGGGAVSRQPAP